jgi:arylsulfatase A-like enzyme
MRPLLLCLAAAPLAASADRPNVLLILADDLGYSDLGCYGGEIPTPNLDALAARGLRFTQCTTSARCCPTRASLLTGLHPHQAGVGSFATRKPDKKRGPAYLGHLNERCATLAEVLGGAGYSTWMVGKWHVGLPGPVERGFEEFYGFTQGYEQDQWRPELYQRLPEGRAPELDPERFYATDVFTDYALEFLRQAREDERPWFLYLAHGAPHFPVQAPPETTATLVERYRRGWDELRSERFERQRASGLATDAWRLSPRSLVPVDREDLAGYPGEPNPPWDELEPQRREDLAHRMAVFAAMVQHVDMGVGRLVADLEAHGQLEDTLIVFLSDNGACYEWGPFGFDGPSRKAGATLHRGEDLARMGGPGTYHAYGSAWANLGNTPLRRPPCGARGPPAAAAVQALRPRGRPRDAADPALAGGDLGLTLGARPGARDGPDADPGAGGAGDLHRRGDAPRGAEPGADLLGRAAAGAGAVLGAPGRARRASWRLEARVGEALPPGGALGALRPCPGPVRARGPRRGAPRARG